MVKLFPVRTTPMIKPAAKADFPVPGYHSMEELRAALEGVELISDDGEPLESHWHWCGINLLMTQIYCWMGSRTDYYVGGNMFVYFSPEQARNRDFRGPDFFVVDGGVSRFPMRDSWVLWEENFRLPDVIIELTSPTTEKEDRTTKFEIYERTFRSRNYFIYDPATGRFDGWELSAEGRYEPLAPNERGWLWCSVLGLWLGPWDGAYDGYTRTWLRFYDADGLVVPTPEEAAEQAAQAQRRHAEAEWQRAEAERQRAEAAEAELARLRALLGERGGNGPALPSS
jgi:Uma2 family endonuclease